MVLRVCWNRGFLLLPERVRAGQWLYRRNENSETC
jgi:hypothetical protein